MNEENFVISSNLRLFFNVIFLCFWDDRSMVGRNKELSGLVWIGKVYSSRSSQKTIWWKWRGTIWTRRHFSQIRHRLTQCFFHPLVSYFPIYQAHCIVWFAVSTYACLLTLSFMLCEALYYRNEKPAGELHV